ncbi:unnamed protein product [Adineta steineri]|uniref:G-protein coupled receptors family 1 profile domain-containing protein n=1 Tax=Adineta steineri TaxID=433720 RepID=A0A814TEJ4_9BILA|nr:unnamed protein product [Adineta steineri]CAF1160685.1 unnamed protein product [Adineta steineri]
MNITSFVKSTVFLQNVTAITMESWLIPMDILMIILTTLVITISCVFLIIIILNKTCHTVIMMLIANTYLSALLFGCCLLGSSVFMFQNDVKQIQDQDSLCNFRGYFIYVSCGLHNYSFLLQAIYRYLTAVYPNRLFWQSRRIQILFICIKWIFCFVYILPILFTNGFTYNVDNQIYQTPLALSFSIIYASTCVYAFPMLLIVLIYFTLVRNVHGMSKRVTAANTLSRAKRELKMVRRIVILVGILLTIGFPYVLFAVISFFTTPPKHHYRIAYIFAETSLVCVLITSYYFTDPLKTSIIKIINRQQNRVIQAVI